MPGIELPGSGLIVGPAAETAISNNSKSPVDFGAKQIIRITFTDSSLYDALTKNKEFRLHGGRSITFSFGDQVQEVLSRPETVRHELYESSKDRLQFAGLLSHQFKIRKIEKESLDDAAEIALKNRMSALNNEKKSKTTMLVDTPLGGRKGTKLPPSKVGASTDLLKKRQQTNARPKESNANSTVKASRPMRSETETKTIEKAVRGPLIFLLALGPETEQNLALKMHAPLDLCRNILQKTANRTGIREQWQLVDDVFRELDLWSFPYATQSDRDKAISNAKQAFERLRLPADAEEWNKLLAPADRGKVDPPVPASLKPKARPGTKTTEMDPKASNGALSPAASEKNLMTRTNSSQPPAKIRKVGEKDTISRIIANKGKPQKEKKEKAATVTKKTAKPPKKTAAGDSSATGVISGRPNAGTNAAKFKSSEFLDSDSDLDSGIITKGVTATKKPGNLKSSAGKKSPVGVSPAPRPGLNDVKVEATKGSRVPSVSPRKNNLSARTVAASRSNDTDSQSRTRKPAISPLPIRNNVSSKASETISVKPGVKKERTTNGEGAIGGKKLPIGKATPTSRVNGVKESRVGGKGVGLKEPLLKRSPITSPAKPSPLGSSPPINASDVDDRSSITPSSLSTVGSTSWSPPDSITANRAKPRSAADQSGTRRRRADNEDDRTPPAKRPRLPDAETLSLARKYKKEYSDYEALYKEVKTMLDSGTRTAAEDAVYNEKWQTVCRMQENLATLKARIWQVAG